MSDRSRLDPEMAEFIAEQEQAADLLPGVSASD
jgi:hypothetical protein